MKHDLHRADVARLEKKAACKADWAEVVINLAIIAMLILVASYFQ